jgi:amidohydrolase
MNMSGSDPKLTVRELLEEAHPALVGLSHWIHANPELGFEETLASGWVAEWLTTAGFEVTTGAAGMPTAVVGSTGPGPLHVVVCVEYDALPVVGHACGHNIIAAAGVGAGVGLASVAERLGLRVTVMGTPAEESGGGKLRLIDAGLFSGVHAAVMVHPWPSDVAQPALIAARTLEVTYLGREAHAGAFPYLGINAADALVVAQTAIGLLRQHLLPTDRVHGIVTKGGDAVNVVPAHTSAQFMVRATTRERLDVLTDLVRRCFEAGSTATGAELAVAEQVAYADMRHDPELAGIYRRNAEALGRTFDEVSSMPVSTDMGDVSYVVPSIHPMIGIEAGDAVNHQAAFAEACATPSADRAVLDGAVALAWTVIDAASDASVRARLLGEADGAVAYAAVDAPAEVEAEADQAVVDEIATAIAVDMMMSEVEQTSEGQVSDDGVMVEIIDEIEVVAVDPSDEVVLLAEVADAFAASSAGPEAEPDVLVVDVDSGEAVVAELESAIDEAVAELEAEAIIEDAVAELEAEAIIEDAMAEFEAEATIEEAVAELETALEVEDALTQPEAVREDPVPESHVPDATVLSRRDRWAQVVGTAAAHDVWSEAFNEILGSSPSPAPESTVAQLPAQPDEMVETDTWWQADLSDDQAPTMSEPAVAEATIDNSVDAWGSPEAWSNDVFDGEWVEGAPSIDGPLTAESSGTTEVASEPDFEWIAPDSDPADAEPASAGSQSGSGKRRKH